MTRTLLALALFPLLFATATYAATNVPRIEDPPRANVPRLTDADDDLLPVESRLGAPTPKAIDPATKAGKGASAPITATFNYDLVIGFIGQVPDAGLITSFFHLDSRNGHFGMDRGGMESLGNAPATGEGGSFDFQVFTNAADHYMYLQSADMGPVSMKAASGQDALGADLEAYFQATAFEETFRKTGKVRNIGANLAGKPYRSAEYAGSNPETGTPLSVWLAVPDFDVGFYAATYYGLGVVPLPKARQQWLVTRMEGDGAVFELSYVMRKPKQFSGAGYRDLSGLMPGMAR
ncbi:MAG: hypothetical protein K0M70_03840 [Arenimonas sp.]|uniref:hypothetical protein n=1 Tax=Arenimonas sp. TaxID=1872635 RepID=UPI0025BD9627|nr:hypothetical protein [Arenimonas sp.]MBW8366973.1 hypothetical protein [Arenimonas sp.]